MGAISVLSLVANVVVSVFAFLSLISWLNSTFVWFGERVGIINLTMDVRDFVVCTVRALPITRRRHLSTSSD